MRKDPVSPETREAVDSRVTYSVLADSRLEAIEKAAGMLRTGVKLREVVEAEQGTPGWWDVVLSTREAA